jgi:hypothetical protein
MSAMLPEPILSAINQKEDPPLGDIAVVDLATDNRTDMGIHDLTSEDASAITGWMSIACWVVVYTPQVSIFRGDHL